MLMEGRAGWEVVEGPSDALAERKAATFQLLMC